MHTFFRMSSAGRLRRRGSGACSEGCCTRLRRRLAERAAGEDGFLLIEVMVSVLLTGLIAVATFNGFTAANRLTADQRRHSVAQLLAAESQEQLRSDPATALDALETEPHSYTRTANGTIFTITQEAEAVSASGSATGCSVNATSKENGANILITSSVTWSLLTKAKRPPVKEASVITPPVGSAVEVDVTNGGAPPAGVAGVTARASFVPEGSAASNSATGTTSSAGCVVLSGLAATEATIEILPKNNFVTQGSLLQYPTNEITIVPNLTTQYPVVYAEGARFEAEFTYKGSTKLGSETVTGDTFVASNTASIPAGYTNFAVGGTAFEYEGEEETYKTVSGTYSPTAFTAAGLKYLSGGLFPFPTAWATFAGDCPKNDVNAEALGTAGTLTPGETTKVQIPLSRTVLNIYKGTQTETPPHTLETSANYPITITNTECEGSETPLHASASNLRHTQTSSKGHLSAPFQPFGKASLCLASGGRTYTVNYNNATAAGSEKSIYIGEITNAEKEAARKKVEAENKAKRESEEKTTEAKRISEETAAREAKEDVEETEKTANLKKEVEADKKYKEEEAKKIISKSTREAKEKEYKTKRESEEKTKKTTRESEESTKRKAAEKAESEARTKKLSEETTFNTGLKKAETEEISKKEVTVGTGSC
jgi:Tfp pilus assembly protein PilV